MDKVAKVSVLIWDLGLTLQEEVLDQPVGVFSDPAEGDRGELARAPQPEYDAGWHRPYWGTGK